MQSFNPQNNTGPAQQPPQNPQPPRSGPRKNGKNSKRTNRTNAPPIRTQHQSKRSSVHLSRIPQPPRGDKTPLSIAMGLKERKKKYIQIRVCGNYHLRHSELDFDMVRFAQRRIRRITLNSGLDWTKTWPKVPANEKAMLFQTVCGLAPSPTNISPWVS
jgi:hypothetical protein